VAAGIGVPVDFAFTSLTGSPAVAAALIPALTFALGITSNFAPDDDRFLKSPDVALFVAGSLAFPEGVGCGCGGCGADFACCGAGALAAADASICFTRSSLIGAGFADEGAGFPFGLGGSIASCGFDLPNSFEKKLMLDAACGGACVIHPPQT
jgi:hypothetical protein